MIIGFDTKCASERRAFVVQVLNGNTGFTNYRRKYVSMGIRIL